MEQSQKEEQFVIDYLGKYYFYEEDEFKRLKKDGAQILKHIEEYSRYQEGDHAFTKSKFGNITESYTEKQVQVSIPSEGDYILINGEKRHLALDFKMELKELEDHVRIGTKLIEEGQSISCLMYVNYDQSKAFINALENLKNRS